MTLKREVLLPSVSSMHPGTLFVEAGFPSKQPPKAALLCHCDNVEVLQCQSCLQHDI